MYPILGHQVKATWVSPMDPSASGKGSSRQRRRLWVPRAHRQATALGHPAFSCHRRSHIPADDPVRVPSSSLALPLRGWANESRQTIPRHCLVQSQWLARWFVGSARFHREGPGQPKSTWIWTCPLQCLSLVHPESHQTLPPRHLQHWARELRMCKPHPVCDAQQVLDCGAHTAQRYARLPQIQQPLSSRNPTSCSGTASGGAMQHPCTATTERMRPMTALLWLDSRGCNTARGRYPKGGTVCLRSE
mmetsp:Transcript_5149/g.18849  ORF Transcript_5149/g.18849 Transcript_5149/m.18849 type:complete len:247 (-) Transcript_5149:103-843(-)